MIITTSQKANASIQEEALELAASLKLPYIERHKKSMCQLFSEGAPIGVVSNRQLTIHFNIDQVHTFHLSMAQLRILRLERGEQDHLVNAINQLIDNNRCPFTIIDCTLGLASDSIVMAYAFPYAQIRGFEASYPIWLSTWYGLAHYEHENPKLMNAMSRIIPIHGNFQQLLYNLPDNSVDILYFDPMFEVPIEESPQFKPLRGHTVESSITAEIIDEAMRVSRYGFIIKERPFSSVFKNYAPHTWIGGKYSRIRYGVWFTKEDNR